MDETEQMCLGCKQVVPAYIVCLHGKCPDCCKECFDNSDDVVDETVVN